MGRLMTSTRSVARRRGTALILSTALGAGALAGCGGSDPEPGPAAPTSSTAAMSKLAGLSADQVLAKTKAAAQSAKSVRVMGEISQQGQSIVIDLKLTGVARGSGTLTLDGGRIDLVRLGNDIYFKADAKTLANTVAQGNAQLVKLIAGRYIKASITTPGFDNFVGLLDLVEFEKGVLSPDGKISRVDGKPVDGVPTVGLKDNDAKDGGVLYVADRGEPYPLRIEPASGPGVVTMSDWNADVTVTAPPADQVIDAKSLE